MDIIFFSHPDFAGHQSMPRLTKMFAKGMEERGHKVKIWSPSATFFSFNLPQSLKKWMGYIDQYVVFPAVIRKRLRLTNKNTLFVFTDHALGPWVPLVADKQHIIHCNDFLAQRSALGEIPENPTSWTGKKYQSFIRSGFQKGKNFISISKKTEQDLLRFLKSKPINSKVVYLGLNNSFKPQNVIQSRALFSNKIDVDLSDGYLLHVGGNQWYKNRLGVVEMYDAWRSTYLKSRLPLILIGEEPSIHLIKLRNQSQFKKDIHFLSKIEDEYVCAAYAGASLFLFPSLAEGFGWPIAEAMASGCPVITTNEAPMTEVAGDAGVLVKKRPSGLAEVEVWKHETASVINQIISLTPDKRNQLINKGLENAKRFDSKAALDTIEKLYLDVMKSK